MIKVIILILFFFHAQIAKKYGRQAEKKCIFGQKKKRSLGAFNKGFSQEDFY